MENQGNEKKIKVMIVNWIGLPEAERKKKRQAKCQIIREIFFQEQIT